MQSNNTFHEYFLYRNKLSEAKNDQNLLNEIFKSNESSCAVPTSSIDTATKNSEKIEQISVYEEYVMLKNYVDYMLCNIFKMIKFHRRYTPLIFDEMSKMTGLNPYLVLNDNFVNQMKFKK